MDPGGRVEICVQQFRNPGRKWGQFMGRMRFVIPRRERVPAGAVQAAYLAGMEGIPWQCRNAWEGDLLVVRRNLTESGNFIVPWTVEGHGEISLATATLREREQPYHLPVELARGTINRLRNGAADWQLGGLDLPEALAQRMEAATAFFVKAATGQSDPLQAADNAEQAIRLGVDAIAMLGNEFSRKMISLRHEHEAHLPTMLAAALDCHPLPPNMTGPLLAAFNTAVIPFLWRDLEPNPGEFQWDLIDRQLAWCENAGLRVCAGPLVLLDKARLPDWLYLWEDTFADIEASILRFVQAAVERYRGRVQVWHSSARLNVGGALNLSEQERLLLAAHVLETVRAADPSTPMIVGFDRPWGEYLAREDHDLSPLHFADTLVRTDVGVAGIGLEMNLGYSPGGTPYRDIMEINRQIDRWSLLGLPLLVMLTVPSSSAADPQARSTSRPVPQDRGSHGPSHQELVERILTLLLAKPIVHGIIWSQLSDAIPHEFPHGGLFDGQSRPKAVLETIAAIRRKHLR